MPLTTVPLLTGLGNFFTRHFFFRRPSKKNCDYGTSQKCDRYSTFNDEKNISFRESSLFEKKLNQTRPSLNCLLWCMGLGKKFNWNWTSTFFFFISDYNMVQGTCKNIHWKMNTVYGYTTTPFCNRLWTIVNCFQQYFELSTQSCSVSTLCKMFQQWLKLFNNTK